MFKPMPLTEDEIYELRECLHKGYSNLWYDKKYEEEMEDDLREEKQNEDINEKYESCR
jgi:Zn ribbon nucleic-acid-binding protein